MKIKWENVRKVILESAIILLGPEVHWSYSYSRNHSGLSIFGGKRKKSIRLKKVLQTYFACCCLHHNNTVISNHTLLYSVFKLIPVMLIYNICIFLVDQNFA